VCRFEAVKEIPRLLRVLKQLYEEEYDFQWTFIGNGDELQWCMDFVNANGLAHVIEFMGKQDNPYIYVKQADVFGLFSKYEGLPNTIYEALILGVPVCATSVGGIKDQVIPHETGWLAENNEKDIFNTLVYIMEHPNEVEQIKKKLINYRYDNQTIEILVNKIFTD